MAQMLFSDNFPLAYAAEDVAYIGDVALDYRIKQGKKQLTFKEKLI